MHQTQIQHIQQLSRKGYSIRQIVAQTRLKRYQVHAIITQLKADAAPGPGGASPVDQSPSSYPLAGSLSPSAAPPDDPERNPEQFIHPTPQRAQTPPPIPSQPADLSVTTAGQQLQVIQVIRQQLELLQLEEARLAEQRQQLAVCQRDLPRLQETYQQYRLRYEQENLVKAYTSLLDDLLARVDRHTWSAGEVSDFLKRAEDLQAQVDKLCYANRIDERRLTLYQGLAWMMTRIEDDRDDQTRGLFASSSVRFAYGPADRAELEAYRVQGFNEESPLPSRVATDPSAADEDQHEQRD